MVTFVTVFMVVYGTFLLFVAAWFVTKFAMKVRTEYNSPISNSPQERELLMGEGFWYSIAAQLKEGS